MKIAAPLNSEAVPTLQWVEVATSFQLPSFSIIGLPCPEVAEARERIRAAMEASDFEFPRRRVVVNLSPASVRKRGTGMDLAMALAVLSCTEHREAEVDFAAWGELGLDGSVKSSGQIMRTVHAAWKGGVSHLLLPSAEYDQARHYLGLLIRAEGTVEKPPMLVPVATLEEAWQAVRTAFREIPVPEEIRPLNDSEENPPVVKGLLPLSPSMERAIALCAAGNHHLMILGPKGTGKSHAMEWLIALQPPTSAQAQVDHFLLAEMGGPRTGDPKHLGPPVRRVSSQARPGSLTGGASPLHIRPGEFSLAHGGLLIADEFPEWARDCRESLREPLERGQVTLTRIGGCVQLPARFTLAANGNLCPCGGWPPQFPVPLEFKRGGPSLPRCRCPQGVRANYLSRLSGPVLDRLDLVLLVGARTVQPEDAGVRIDTRLAELRAKIREVRTKSVQTWGALPSALPADRIEGLLTDHSSWGLSLRSASSSSLRARHKTVRLAMTLALWDGSPLPSPAHFAEASCYRPERLGLCE